MDLSAGSTAYLVVGAAALFGGISQGASGFGFNLIFISTALLVLTPHATIPIASLLAAILNFAILFKVRKNIDLINIAPLVIAALIAIPAGAHVLLKADGELMKSIAGGLVVLFSIAYLAGFERHIVHEKAASVFVGLLSGFLNSSVGFSGPPVVFFYTNQHVRKDVFKANLAVYFFVITAITSVAYFYNGLLNVQMTKFALTLIPELLVGMIIGMILASRINEKTFRKLVLVIVACAGLLAVFS